MHVPCIDAFEQHRELTRVNLYASLTVLLANAPERALLQALCEDAVAVTIPEQDADLCPATIQEDEEVAAQWTESEL
jgi:hypothetical protein